MFSNKIFSAVKGYPLFQLLVLLCRCGHVCSQRSYCPTWRASRRPTPAASWRILSAGTVPATGRRGQGSPAGCCYLATCGLNSGIRSVGQGSPAGCCCLATCGLNSGIRSVGQGSPAGCCCLAPCRLNSGIRSVGQGSPAGCCYLATWDWTLGSGQWDRALQQDAAAWQHVDRTLGSGQWVQLNRSEVYVSFTFLLLLPVRLIVSNSNSSNSTVSNMFIPGLGAYNSVQKQKLLVTNILHTAAVKQWRHPYIHTYTIRGKNYFQKICRVFMG